MTNKAQAITYLDVLREALEAQSDIDGAKNAAGAVSQHLLDLAKLTVAKVLQGVKPKDMEEAKKKAIKAFIDKCEGTERVAKSDGIYTVLPRCWSQAKSNIKAAMTKGVDILKYDTEASMRKTLNEVRKAEKATPEGENTPEDNEALAEEYLNVSPKLKTAIENLLSQIVTLNDIDEGSALRVVLGASKNADKILRKLNIKDVTPKKDGERKVLEGVVVDSDKDDKTNTAGR